MRKIPPTGWAPGGVVLSVLVLLALPVRAQTDPAAIESLITRGDYAAAEQALRAAPPAPRADYLLGFVLIQTYRYQEAETLLRRALEREPDRPAWLQALAKALLEQGRNRAAIEVLDRAIALEPHPDYLFAQAMCALNAGETTLAERALRRSLELDPRRAEARYKLGKMLIDRDEIETGRDELRAALESDPGHLEARFLLGLAERRLGRLDAAATAFETVLAEVPGHVGALYNLGQVRLRQGRREEATARLEAFRAMSTLRDEIDFMTQVVKKNPDNVDSRLELGRKLLEVGRAEDALRELLVARRMAPRRAAVYRLLARAFERLGRRQDAAQAAAFAAELERGGG